MSKLGESVKGAKGFLGDVGGEAKKVAWPDRKELVSSTTVVIVSMLLLSFFVGVSDWALITLLKVLLRAG